MAFSHQPHSRTVAVLRFLRAAGPLPRRRRIPRQQQPDLIRLEYFKAITPFIELVQRSFEREKSEIMWLLSSLRRAQGKTDAGEEARAKELIARASRRAANELRPRELEEVALKFGKRTSDFQREQLDRQVRAAMSVPLSVIEKPIVEKLNEFAAKNADLIVTVPERYFDRIRAEVQEAFESGMHPSTLAERLVEINDMSENDAQRIARDQIGKLNGQLNEERQTAMGVTGYIWRGAMDNRERDEHMDREGQHFEWDDPPEDGHPGEPIQCRCWAEPDFSAILEDAE